MEYGERSYLPPATRQLRAGILAIHCEPQEVGRARDARIIVSNRLLALPRQFFRWQVKMLGDEFPQILFDGLLILRRGRDDLGVEDGALFVEPVAMIENPSRSFRTAEAGGGARLDFDPRFLRRLIGGD